MPVPPKTNRKCVGGKCADPVWKSERARKAGLANRKVAEQRRLAIGKRYPTKGAAYAAGYRQGYHTAMQWWERKYSLEGLKDGHRRAPEDPKS